MNFKKITREVVLFFIFIILILPTYSHAYDVSCWSGWAKYIYSNGIGNVYKSGANYPPVLMYFLSVYNFFQKNDQKIIENINYLKIIPFLFDLIPVIILIIFRKLYALKNGYHFLLLFNVAYLYNTIVWGQLDSIHSNMVLTAIFISFRYPTLAIVLFILALNMKLQAIIFFPVVVLCVASKFNSYKTIFKSITIGILVQVIILIPFISANTLADLWKVVIESGSYYPVASMDAYNLWHLVLKKHPREVSDQYRFLHLTYKSIGLILFFVMSAVTLFPLILKTARTIIEKVRPIKYQELTFLSTAIIVLIFFFFNTEMHERYSHPAVIFIFFYSIYRGKFGLYLLISVAYLLNIENILHYYNIPHHTLIFNPKFIAYLFLLSIIVGIINIYRHYALKDDLTFFKNAICLRRNQRAKIAVV